MNQRNRATEDLLAEVLASEDEHPFREALLAGTLRQARWKRRRQRAGRVGAALAVLMVLAGLGSRWFSRRSAGEPVEWHCAIVRTQPLPAEARVATRPFNPAGIAGTRRFAAVVETKRDAGAWRQIDDGQLLALAGARPAVLVRIGPQAQELIFLDRKNVRPERIQ